MIIDPLTKALARSLHKDHVVYMLIVSYLNLLNSLMQPFLLKARGIVEVVEIVFNTLPRVGYILFNTLPLVGLGWGTFDNKYISAPSRSS